MASFLHTYESFLWSEQEYELRSLVDHFGHQLPLMFFVTEGYLGRNEAHNITSDSVFWLHEVTTQSRVVVRSQNLMYYTIPLSYKEKVIPIGQDGKDQAETTLTDMIQRGSTRRFYFAEDGSHPVCLGPDAVHNECLGRMEFIEMYDVRFLVVHVVLSDDFDDPDIFEKTREKVKLRDGIYPRPMLIPVYLPILVTLGVSMANGDNITFSRTLLRFKQCSDKQPGSYDKLTESFSDIMKYKEKPTNGDYEYIQFMSLVKVKNEDGDGSGYPSAKSDFGYSYAKNVNDQSKQTSEETTIARDLATCERIDPKFIVLKPSSWPVVVGLDLYERMTFLHRILITGNIPGYKPEELPPLLPREPIVPGHSASAASNPGRAASSSGLSFRAERAYDIPKDISGFTIADIGYCLKLLNLERHVPEFESRQIDGQFLQCLDADMLVDEFGFDKINARKLVLFATKGWRPK